MFTGIITQIGTVKSIRKSGDWIFTIAAQDFAADAVIGASIACSGTCLTLLTRDAAGFTVQASQETLNLTTLGSWKEGTRLNLERALKVGDELGGHFVSGHVDGVATLTGKEAIGESFKLTFAAPAEYARFIAAKGSVVLDGVSLTVNEAKGDSFAINIIPHTLTHTTLGDLKPDDKVNLEIDIIARYLARLKEA